MKYIIVDDERFAHDVIKGYCDQMPNLQFVQSCYDAIEASECLKNKQVDLIFLDLNMPKISGFDFIKTLSHVPKVIVTTAHQEFALEGYELNIADYLLKPISFGRFLKALNKIDRVNTISPAAPNQSMVNEGGKSLFLKSNKSYYQVELENILFVESTGNYCKVVTPEKEIVVKEKISSFIRDLPSDSFFQVHKSFFVSKRQIDSIEGNRIFIGDHEIPIGRHYKANVNGLLNGR